MLIRHRALAKLGVLAQAVKASRISRWIVWSISLFSFQARQQANRIWQVEVEHHLKRIPGTTARQGRASIDAPGAVGGRSATNNIRRLHGWLVPATSPQTHEVAVGVREKNVFWFSTVERLRND